MSKKNIDAIIKQMNDQMYMRHIRVLELLNGDILGKDEHSDHVPLKSVWAEIVRLNNLETIKWEDKPLGRYSMIEYNYIIEGTTVASLTTLRTIDFNKDNEKVEKEYLISD